MRIIYLEKNQNLRNSYSIYLENLPFAVTVDCFGTTKKALEAMEGGEAYDLVVASHGEGQAEGLAFYTTVSQTYPLIPFLLLADNKVIRSLEILQLKKERNTNFVVP